MTRTIPASPDKPFHEWALEKAPIKFWLARPYLSDFLFALTTCAVLLAAHALHLSRPSMNLDNFYAALVSALGSLLGFVLAALTIVSGLISHVLRVMSREETRELIASFNSTLVLGSAAFFLALLMLLLKPADLFFTYFILTLTVVVGQKM